jgi:excisionase family DNA binding protein
VSDAGLSLSLPPETLDALVERVAELVLERASGRDQTNPYLTVAETAELLRAKQQRVYDLLSARRLTRYKDGRRVLVRRAELERYLAEHGTSRVAPALPLSSRTGLPRGLPS